MSKSTDLGQALSLIDTVTHALIGMVKDLGETADVLQVPQVVREVVAADYATAMREAAAFYHLLDKGTLDVDLDGRSFDDLYFHGPGGSDKSDVRRLSMGFPKGRGVGVKRFLCVPAQDKTRDRLLAWMLNQCYRSCEPWELAVFGHSIQNQMKFIPPAVWFTFMGFRTWTCTLQCSKEESHMLRGYVTDGDHPLPKNYYAVGVRK